MLKFPHRRAPTLWFPCDVRVLVCGRLSVEDGAVVVPEASFPGRRERAWTAIHHVQSLRREGNVREAWAEAVIANEIAARGFLPGEDAPWIEAERRALRDMELQALEAVCEAELDQHRASEPTASRAGPSPSTRFASPAIATSCARSRTAGTARRQPR